MNELKALLSQYVGELWQRRWAIILVAWLVCLAGWLAVALLPNRYASTAQIYVDTESVLGPLMDKLAVSPDIQRQVEVMRQTLLTRPNVEQLIKMADLDLKLNGPIERQRLIEELPRRIDVSALGKNLFKVSYESTDAQESYRVVDSVLQIFVEQNVGITQRDVDSAQEFIQRQIADYEAKLRDAEAAVATYQREHAEELGGVGQAQRQLESTEANLRSMSSEFDSAVWQRDQLATQLATIPRYLSQAEAARVATPAEQRLADLRQRLSQAQLTYTDQHPGVVTLKNLVAQAESDAVAEHRASGGGPEGPRLDNPLYRQIQEQLSAVELRVADLQRRIELAQPEIAKLSALVAQTPQVEAGLTRLTRDYDVLITRHKELTERAESARLAKRLDAETNRIDFRIVEPPVKAVTPSGPPHGLLMAGVLAVGFGAGVGWALLRIQLDGTLRSTAQLKSLFDLPVLGSISIVRSALHRRLRAVEALSLGVATLALLAVFSGVFYLYQFRPTKPDVPALARTLQTEFAERAAPWLQYLRERV
jgi:polysaccharide chain length determinant protein (PEP-CTERM system associated)